MQKQKLRSFLELKNANSPTNNQNSTEHREAKILKKQERETAIQQITGVGEVTESIQKVFFKEKRNIEGNSQT